MFSHAGKVSNLQSCALICNFLPDIIAKMAPLSAADRQRKKENC